MVHFPVLRTLNIVLRPERLLSMGPFAAVAAYAASIAICVACAAVLYYAIERPLRSRLRNVVGEMPPAAAMSAAAAKPG
jgi:peptidoglycan/LPS O-acetylase OafA/YrhL